MSTTTSRETHTPGSWYIEITPALARMNDAIRQEETGELICEFPYGASEGSGCEANARLVAAAPELLCALRELVLLAEHGDADQDEQNWHPALNAARAAIAKASQP